MEGFNTMSPNDKFEQFKSTTSSSGFVSLITTQFLGAFNDNSFKTLITLYISAKLPESERGFYIAFATILLLAPFILFSTHCGYFCDKYSKRTIMIIVKLWEILITVFGFAAFYYDNIPMLLMIIFFLGLHSTLFSPAKYGSLPEVLREEELSRGNGIIELTTFISIIIGTISASILFRYFKGGIHLAAVFFLVVAVLGLATCITVPRIPAAGVSGPFKWNFLSEVYYELKSSLSDRPLYLTIVGITYFWLLATAVNNNIILYSKEMLMIGEDEMGFLMAALAVGIGFGSGIAGRLSGDMVEFGLVPLGAIGMTLFLFDLNFSHGGIALRHAFFYNDSFSYFPMVRTGIDLFMVGLFGGFFIVPLHAFLQQCAPNGETGRIVGLTNFTANLFMVVAAALVYVMHDLVRIPSSNIFAVVSICTLLTTVYIIVILPDFLLRFFIFMISNIIYAVKVAGTTRIPISGPALIVSNHVSLIDAIIINTTSHRHIRFMIRRENYENSRFKWVYRLMRIIPVTGGKLSEEEIATARGIIENGDVLCMFPEGDITCDGLMKEFNSDFVKVLKGSDARIIPAYIHGMWGSIFSVKDGRPIWKIPKKPVRYPVTIEFGEFMPASSSHDEVRASVAGIAKKYE